MIDRTQLFDQPAFISPFTRTQGFSGLSIGITGQRGVLGGVLCRRLQDSGAILDSYPGDITDSATLGSWFATRRFDLFFHFAAMVPVEQVERDPVRAFEANAIGALRVCQGLAAQRELPWTFLASTSHVYGPCPVAELRALSVGSREQPATLYGRSKLAAEVLCSNFLEAVGRRFCIARIFSFSHATQREPYLVPRLRRQLAHHAGGPFRVVNPHSVRDIVDAETVIDAVLHLAARRFNGTINVGSGAGLTVGQIAERVAEQMGMRIQVEGDQRAAPDALVADVSVLKSALS